jgi:spore coat protein U-like protein
MTGPGALRFQLYSNSGYTTPWGSWPLGLYGGGFTWDVLSTATTLTASTTVYAQILAGQQTISPGSYTSTLTLFFTYQNNTNTACPFTGQGNSTTTFPATATILSSCTVSAANLNFGTVGVLSSNVDATNSVSPTCTNGTPYNVGLNQGLNGGSVTTRQMNAGAARVSYSLFRDSGRTLNWATRLERTRLRTPARDLRRASRSTGGFRPRRPPRPASITTRLSSR